MVYLINDEHTMNDLYGDIVVDWSENLLVLRSIRNATQSRMIINKSANYQLREAVPPRKKVTFSVLDKKTIQEISRKSNKVEKIMNRASSKKFFQNVGSFTDIISKRSEMINIYLPDYSKNFIKDDKEYQDEIKKIIFPDDSAISVPEARKKLTAFGGTSVYRNDMEKVSSDVIAPILAEIDRDKLILRRANKKNQNVYTLQEIQDFARRLGISVSNKNKVRLVENIIKMIEDQANINENKEFD